MADFLPRAIAPMRDANDDYRKRTTVDSMTAPSVAAPRQMRLS
jgi:hypothetical protein